MAGIEAGLVFLLTCQTGQAASPLVSMAGSPLPDVLSDAANRCESIYIDLGSNVGVQPRAFFEPKMCADNYMQPTFSAVFGDGDARRTSACVFGFEAHPRLVSRLREIELCYAKRGWRLRFYHAVALDADDTLVDIHSDVSSHEHFWGSGISDALVRGRSELGVTVDAVPSVDIARWIDELLLAHRPSRVFVKMDIEGSEFVVLPRLHERGLLCKDRVAAMDIEWHSLALAELAQPFRAAWDAFSSAGKMSWETNPSFKPVFANQPCGEGTAVVPFSTEDQLHDQVPLPCDKHLRLPDREAAGAGGPGDRGPGRGAEQAAETELAHCAAGDS